MAPRPRPRTADVSYSVPSIKFASKFTRTVSQEIALSARQHVESVRKSVDIQLLRAVLIIVIR